MPNLKALRLLPLALLAACATRRPSVKVAPITPSPSIMAGRAAMAPEATLAEVRRARKSMPRRSPGREQLGQRETTLLAAAGDIEGAGRRLDAWRKNPRRGAARPEFCAAAVVIDVKRGRPVEPLCPSPRGVEPFLAQAADNAGRGAEALGHYQAAWESATGDNKDVADIQRRRRDPSAGPVPQRLLEHPNHGIRDAARFAEAERLLNQGDRAGAGRLAKGVDPASPVKHVADALALVGVDSNDAGWDSCALHSTDPVIIRWCPVARILSAAPDAIGGLLPEALAAAEAYPANLRGQVYLVLGDDFVSKGVAEGGAILLYKAAIDSSAGGGAEFEPAVIAALRAAAAAGDLGRLNDVSTLLLDAPAASAPARVAAHLEAIQYLVGVDTAGVLAHAEAVRRLGNAVEIEPRAAALSKSMGALYGLGRIEEAHRLMRDEILPLYQSVGARYTEGAPNPWCQAAQQDPELNARDRADSYVQCADSEDQAPWSDAWRVHSGRMYIAAGALPEAGAVLETVGGRDPLTLAAARLLRARLALAARACDAAFDLGMTALGVVGAGRGGYRVEGVTTLLEAASCASPTEARLKALYEHAVGLLDCVSEGCDPEGAAGMVSGGLQHLLYAANPVEFADLKVMGWGRVAMQALLTFALRRGDAPGQAAAVQLLRFYSNFKSARSEEAAAKCYQPKAAIALCSKAPASCANAPAHLYLAKCKEALGDDAGAAEQLRLAGGAALSLGTPELRRARAEAKRLLAAGRYGEAASLLDGLLDRLEAMRQEERPFPKSEHADLLFTRAEVQLGAGSPSAALAAAERGLALHEHEAGLRIKARALFALGRLPAAGALLAGLPRGEAADDELYYRAMAASTDSAVRAKGRSGLEAMGRRPCAAEDAACRQRRDEMGRRRQGDELIKRAFGGR